MLPKNIRCADMVGKFVTLDRGVRNGGGCCISAGTDVYKRQTPATANYYFKQLRKKFVLAGYSV